MDTVTATESGFDLLVFGVQLHTEGFWCPVTHGVGDTDEMKKMKVRFLLMAQVIKYPSELNYKRVK